MRPHGGYARINCSPDKILIIKRNGHHEPDGKVEINFEKRLQRV